MKIRKLSFIVGLITILLALTAQNGSVRSTPNRNLGEIRGQFLRCGVPSVGATAYVPGTSHVARTDSTGTYRMLFVPQGDYSLAFDEGVTYRAFVPWVRVRAERVTNVGQTDWCPDGDGDGADHRTDCDDSNSSIRPGGQEVCNGIDDDCDGLIDEIFNLSSDRRNCGVCGNVCDVDQACILGNCLRPQDPVPSPTPTPTPTPTATPTPTPLPPRSTRNVSLAGNLDAATPTGSVPTFPTTFSDLSAFAEFSIFVNIFDNLGASHTVTVYFFHVGPNAWTVIGVVDGGEIVGGTAGAPTQIFSAPLTFDASGERVPLPLPDPDATTVNPWTNGATAEGMSFRFQPYTQFSAASAIGSIEQDGNGP